MRWFGLRAGPGTCSNATLFGILSVRESRKVVQMRRFAYVRNLESVQMRRLTCSNATLFEMLSVCESRKVVQMRRFAYVQDLESVQMQRILCSDAMADLFKCNADIPGLRQP